MGRETSLVLAIEPDTTRAEALRQIVRDRLGIELVLVSSPYAANVAMNRQLPELLLFSSSLSDRNQNKVIAHYRALTDGIDPQTLIIPLLRDTGDDGKVSRFSFKWKRQSQGTSANVFLDTIASYLKRAGTQPPRTPSVATPLPTIPPPAADAGPGSTTNSNSVDTTAEPVAVPAELASSSDASASADLLDASAPSADVDAGTTLPTAPPPHDDTPSPVQEPDAAPVELPRLVSQPTASPEVSADHAATNADDTALIEDGEEVLLDVAFSADVMGAAAMEPAEDPSEEPTVADQTPDAPAADQIAMLATDDAPDHQAPHPLSDTGEVDANDTALVMSPEVSEPAIEEELAADEDDAGEPATLEAFIETAQESSAGNVDVETTSVLELSPSTDVEPAESLDLVAVDEPTPIVEDTDPTGMAELATPETEVLALDEPSDTEPAAIADAQGPSYGGGALALSDGLHTSLDQLFDEVHIDPGTLAIEATTDDEEEPGIDLSALMEAPSGPVRESGVDPEVHAAEIALIKLEAEQKLAGELDRLRLEAVQQREAELARLHAEAEALRQSTVAQARAAAEAEARDAWAGELARVRAEAEQTVTDALNRVRSEAEQTLTSEVLRARAEAEQERQAQLAHVQAELERAREEAERVRQAQLAHVQAAEERVDSVTRQAREAEAEAAQERLAQIARLQAEAEALREDAVARARAEVEAEAREALAAELSRVREEAAQSVNEALNRVRQEAASTVTSEVSRAREQAEMERSEELARIEAALDARVSEATRAARAAAEAEASKTFSSELERARVQAEQTFASEVARLRNEAQLAAEERDRVLASVTSEREADRARALAEAEAMREQALVEARQAAENAAQRAMEREVERVKAEADARMRDEVERLRSEAERARSERSEAALEAEKVREAAREVEREIARVRAASEARLQEELEQVRREAERAREAERRTAREEAERMREAAARDARAVAEAALKAELDRVRAESESRLAAELEQLRTETEQQRSSELAELRSQMSQVRDAAAQQAQKAASDAIAAEVARANRDRAAAAVPPPPPPLPGTGLSAAGGPASTAARPPAPQLPPLPGQRAGSTFSVPVDVAARRPEPPRQPSMASEPAPRKRERDTAWMPPPPPPSMPPARRWQVPAIGAVLLIAAATASYNWLPVRVQWQPEAASSNATPSEPEAKPTPAAPRLGGPVTLDSLPTGATVSIDGRNRGTAPLTLTDLTAGTHAVLFEANGVTVARSIRVRAEQPLTVSQEMTAGFLSVFSRVPVEIFVDGRRAGSTDDTQLLVGPGSHKVLLENTRFNFRSEFSIDVKPGEVAAHTVMLPMGALVLSTDAGAEVWVEGERIGVAPLGPIAVPIGTREVVVKLSGNEVRQSIEVVYGRQSELTLSAANVPGPTPAEVPPTPLAPLVAPSTGAQTEPRERPASEVR